MSEKTIERMARRGQVQQAVKRRPGTHSIVVFHPGDVEKLKAELDAAAQPEAFVVPAGSKQRTAVMESLTALMQVAANEIATAIGKANHTADVPLHEKLHLNLKEAVKVSNLPLSYLKEAMKDGRLKFFKIGSRYRFKKADLANITDKSV